MKYQKSQNRTPLALIKFALCIALLCTMFFAIGSNKTIAMAGSERHYDVTNEKERSTNVLSGPKWKTSRPRLFFTPERIKRLRMQVEEEAALRKESIGLREAWLKLLKRADHLLKAKLVSKEYADGGTGQHGNYGRPSSQISDMASTLGLAYQMTGEKRYAEKLKKALIHYGGLRRWAGDARRNPPWNSELNTARFCYAYAVGYDSIYDYLSEKDRRTIAQTMVRMGVLPTLNDWVLGEKRIHALDSMGHNW